MRYYTRRHARAAYRHGRWAYRQPLWAYSGIFAGKPLVKIALSPAPLRVGDSIEFTYTLTV